MKSSAGKPDIQVALAALKAGFAKKIPDKIREIGQSWETVKSAPEDAEILPLFHRQVHTLAGTAATYGFIELGRLAKAVETSLQDELQEAAPALSVDSIARLEPLVAQLGSVL
ncbi:MAG: Hpt domain-containing protein [Mariprofundus sp.]